MECGEVLNVECGMELDVCNMGMEGMERRA